jgi:hypothetical protein
MNGESSYEVLPEEFLRRRATFEAARVGEMSKCIAFEGTTESLSG